MNMTEIERALRELRLSGIADTLSTRVMQAQAAQQPFLETFAAMLQDELDRRRSRLLERCQRAFSQWRDTISAALQAGGCAAPRASAFATLLLASVQGAIVLARAEGHPAPFDVVADQLRAQAATLV